MLRLPILLLLVLATVASAQDPRTTYLNADQADADFSIQGEYQGQITVHGQQVKFGLQIVAGGGGQFRSVGYGGGLPGDGWDGNDELRFPGAGQLEDGVCVLIAEDESGQAVVQDGTAVISSADGTVLGSLSKVTRRSPTLGAKPPEGAVVLFDGSTAEHFENGRMTEDGLLKQGVTSRQKFGSYQLHMEFQLSYMPWARKQDRANSGCYHQGRFEVQILDSFGLTGEDNECGGIYRIAPPRINMCYPPLSWQTYDVEFHAAQYDGDGNKTAPAWITVRHNGVEVHRKQKLEHATRAHPFPEGPEPGPLYLQDHSNEIRFRNIWVMPQHD